jgi:hypothetical protein
MSNIVNKEVLKGLTIAKKDSGLWLCFENNGKHADINIDVKFLNTFIIRETIIDWAESHLYAEAT